VYQTGQATILSPFKREGLDTAIAHRIEVMTNRLMAK
jgi:hypothetical protein